MFAVVFIACVAAAAAAPFYPGGPPPYHPDHHLGFEHRFRYSEDLFDTRRFWGELEREMRELDVMLQDFSKRFPAMSSEQKIDGTEYKVTIPLRGYEEKDIVVKAKEGLLMVQAVHSRPEGQTTYLDVKTLPPCVNVTGTWVYEDDILKITFPLKADSVEATTAIATTERNVLEDNNREETEGNNREEMETTENNATGDIDADVGVRGDQKEVDIFTNEVLRDRVETTTYAVDLNNDVEFVPVRY